MKTVIGTGWHSRGKPRNSVASKRMYQADYLETVWIPYIERFIEPEQYFVYVSNCDILPKIGADVQAVYSIRSDSQHHNNDYISSYFMGALYAWINECHFVYIEQDCLVYGLDKALKFAQDKTIVYGYGQYSPAPRWPETSFTFINWEFIPEFLKIGTSLDWAHWKHRHDDSPFGEMVWKHAYQEYAAFWPFGYGRTRPIDFSQKVFYAQQMNDELLDRFLEKT